MSQRQTGNKMLLTLSENLNVDSRSLTKAEEYLRIIRDKATGRYVNDLTKAILCIHLAATRGGFAFNTDKALTLSGLQKIDYKRYLQLYEKLLNLEKTLTIPEACVQLTCSEVKDLAHQILSKYKENNVVDDTNPMYISAAISAACRIKNIKVARSKFLEVSRLKATQWKELEAKFQKHIDCFNVPNKTSRIQTEICVDEVDIAKENQDFTERKSPAGAECEDEDYETWKARILSEARAALQTENENV